MRMKTRIPSIKRLCLIAAIVAGINSGITASTQAQTNKLRVGIYDSRAVAVAYANSTEFEFMKPIEADHKKAKETKDDKRVKEIESWMKFRQTRAHEQAFSTGSVAPIMETVKDRLSEVAKQSGVQLIVSKWEVSHQSSEIETVNVTDKIVELFHVSERGLKWSKEIQQKPPISIEKIHEHMD